MTSAVLAGLLHRQPFQPFTFVLGDQVEVYVDSPERVRHETGARIVVVTASDGGERIIDLDHVGLIEVSKPRP
jgi:hypothetical protein